MTAELRPPVDGFVDADLAPSSGIDANFASMTDLGPGLLPAARARPGLTQAADVVITSGLSVHVFGDTVGIYSKRIEAGRGFAEMPVADMLALMSYFAQPESRKLLELQS